MQTFSLVLGDNLVHGVQTLLKMFKGDGGPPRGPPGNPNGPGGPGGAGPMMPPPQDAGPMFHGGGPQQGNLTI